MSLDLCKRYRKDSTSFCTIQVFGILPKHLHPVKVQYKNEPMQKYLTRLKGIV